jgi:hypothetical protein
MTHINNHHSVPRLIEKTPVKFDIHRIRVDVDSFLNACKVGRFRAFTTENKMWSLNLNYPPNPEQYDPGNPYCKFRGKLSGNESALAKVGITSKDFTEMLPAVSNSYLGEVYRSVKAYHDTNHPNLGTITRIHVAFMADGASYQLHMDPHTGAKYHIPVWTNPYSYMMVDDEGELKSVNMEADGHLWRLDTNRLHTALNLMPKSASREDRIRAHIIIVAAF